MMDEDEAQEQLAAILGADDTLRVEVAAAIPDSSVESDGYCPTCKLGGRAMERSVARMAKGLPKLSAARSAQLTMIKGMARACDENPDRGALWREYRIALHAFQIEMMGSGDDDFDRLAKALGTEVGDTED